MKLAVLGAIATFIGLVLAELWLRRWVGLGTPLLYQADPHIGYLLAPNQQVQRFGNHVLINQFSMRSGAIAAGRPANTLRVLLLGDSVANGGTWTNQPDIVSERMQRILQSLIQQGLDLCLDPYLKKHPGQALAQRFPTPASDLTQFRQVEVLNASTSSWGPRNQLAYLKQFGSFGAQVIVLLINTDDLFAAVPTSAPVGRDRHYPNRRPRSALTDAVNLGLARFYPFHSTQPAPVPERDPVGANLAAIEQMGAIAQQSDAAFMLAMTPLQREIKQPRDYELQTRQRLDEFLQQRHIPYLDFLPLFRETVNPSDLFRDHIHLSLEGTRLVSQVLSAAVWDWRLRQREDC